MLPKSTLRCWTARQSSIICFMFTRFARTAEAGMVACSICRRPRSHGFTQLDRTLSSLPLLHLLVCEDIADMVCTWTACLQRIKNMVTNALIGYFTMDMTQANGLGGLPNIDNVTTNEGAAPSGGAISDGDRASIFHGVVMAMVFLMMYPFNMVIIEVFKWHRVGTFFSIIFQLLLLTAFALGMYVSTEYIRVRLLRCFQIQRSNSYVFSQKNSTRRIRSLGSSLLADL
jgi:hypothetical protein